MKSQRSFLKSFNSWLRVRQKRENIWNSTQSLEHKRRRFCCFVMCYERFSKNFSGWRKMATTKIDSFLCSRLCIPPVFTFFSCPNQGFMGRGADKLKVHCKWKAEPLFSIKRSSFKSFNAGWSLPVNLFCHDAALKLLKEHLCLEKIATTQKQRLVLGYMPCRTLWVSNLSQVDPKSIPSLSQVENSNLSQIKSQVSL